MFEGPRRKKKERPLSRRAVLLLVLLTVAVVAGLRYGAARRAPAPVALPPVVAGVAPFTRFDHLGAGGWVGELSADWEGFQRAAVADAVCATLIQRLHPSGTQTILLTGPEGHPNRECGGAASREPPASFAPAAAGVPAP